jgi:hypothetical protein
MTLAGGRVTQRTKHIDVKAHYLRDQVKNGTIVVSYVNTLDNIADIFTKCVSPQVFEKLAKLIVH